MSRLCMPMSFAAGALIAARRRSSVPDSQSLISTVALNRPEPR